MFTIVSASEGRIVRSAMSWGDWNSPVGAIRYRLFWTSSLPASTTIFCWLKVATMLSSVRPSSDS